MSVRLIAPIFLMLSVLTAMNSHSQNLAPVPDIDPVTLTVPDPFETEPGMIGVNNPVQADATDAGRDVVLVLDNSVSMKTNDPQSQLAQLVMELGASLGDDTNIGIVLYGQEAKLVMPLLPATIANRERLAETLAQLDYSGLYSNSPAAIESAVLELNTSGRESADKYIIFMTDGNVQTGDDAIDIERTVWLLQNLAVDIAAAGIRIYGVGFADAANSELVSTMALKTGGESLYASNIDEMPAVFNTIAEYIKQDAGPVMTESTDSGNMVAVAVEPPPEPVLVSPTTTPPLQVAGKEEHTRSIIIIVAAGVLILTVGIILVLLLRRNRIDKKAAATGITEAFLYDLNGNTAASTYKLGLKPTMLGRVAGRDADHLDYIVIPESTIGRRHATIEYKDYAYWIMDQGSINGTFVNNVRITSETRLKHGDRIRLHKIEFDFVMPDMEEAGMTRVADPDAAAAAAALEIDIEAVKSSMGSNDQELDFDFSGTEPAAHVMPDDGKDETLLPGFSMDEHGAGSGQSEATLMPDFEHVAAKESKSAAATRADIKPHDDETLLPDSFVATEDDDETLRPSTSSASSDIFDVTGSDDGKEDR